MRTFEEVQKYLSTECQRLIMRFSNMSEEERRSNHLSKENVEALCKSFQSNIDNIDEFTISYIGNRVNSFINGVKRLGGNFIPSNLEPNAMIVKNILSSYPDMGFTFDDVKRFAGQYGLSRGFGDDFRQYVNGFMGTNIPMNGEVEKVQREMGNVEKGTVEHDKLFVQYKELQRDAGLLFHGIGECHFLATDLAYQEAKSRCSGMTR